MRWVGFPMSLDHLLAKIPHETRMMSTQVRDPWTHLSQMSIFADLDFPNTEPSSSLRMFLIVFACSGPVGRLNTPVVGTSLKRTGCTQSCRKVIRLGTASVASSSEVTIAKAASETGRTQICVSQIQSNSFSMVSLKTKLGTPFLAGSWSGQVKFGSS